jgi:hypothetical protein
VGTPAYHLELPPDNHIHLMFFYVSQLKQYTPHQTSILQTTGVE